MQGTVDGFSYGMVTPLTAYVMACLGAALGLRCVTRSLHDDRSWKPGWLALGAASIGCGIWTMHFIAMIGFQVEESDIRYDVGLTVLSLLVAIAVVGIGVFAVGYRGAGTTTLLVAGVFTGLGVAAMHYIGMAAIRLNGGLRYDTATVALSVLIALVAATAALWAAVAIRGFLTSLGASLVMGGAVSGMHYTGMAAVSVHLHGAVGGPGTGGSAHSLLLPMLIGPVLFLVLAAVVVMFDPLLVLGDGDWNRTASRRAPASRTDRPAWSGGSAFEPPPRRVSPGGESRSPGSGP
ncbi:NO-binding membrane sensor protein with MHYT domain [Streptomyces sp. V3I8]|jgi:NO-binding membrane sensor protein with MHYT domain|uniref:MHYT domain-containing protein n=1 Tax=Streptomyces sp. V3I8 TaxID=3042279 RepID=UPI0027875194|nr:MHYT domain-containing protein [Streptomyces sp. V3I8]MDQ1040268.1 NO-binding membrane sensor protein with MHYT domain [Streptomyces sp. V3I8]